MAHLTRSQRDQIEVLHHDRWKQEEIARAVGCHQATVSRELSRNNPHPRMRYQANVAHRCAEERRRRAQENAPKWHDNPAVLRYIVEQLRKGHSPEQISGRMKRASPWHRQHTMSHAAIYQYLWKTKEEGGVLHRYLRRKGRRPRSRRS